MPTPISTSLPRPDQAAQAKAERRELGPPQLREKTARFVAQGLERIAAALQAGELDERIDLFEAKRAWGAKEKPLRDPEFRTAVTGGIQRALNAQGYEVEFDTRDFQHPALAWRDALIVSATVSVDPNFSPTPPPGQPEGPEAEGGNLVG
jgi:hypothetical protein